LSEGSSLEPGIRRLYLFIAWISLVTIVAVSFYGLIAWVEGHSEIVGQQLVNVYWPYPPYFAQPVTYFSVACVALAYTGLRLCDSTVRRWPRGVISFLQLIGFLVAFSSAYEVLYNFMLWGSIYSIACSHAVCDPDAIISTYPVPWNLVFATRAFSALFVVSGYCVYYLRRLTKDGII